MYCFVSYYGMYSFNLDTLYFITSYILRDDSTHLLEM